jgi:hypothetical protein
MSESGDAASENGSIVEENDHDMVGGPDAEESDAGEEPEAAQEPEAARERVEPEPQPEPEPEPGPEPPKTQGSKKKSNTLKMPFNKQVYEIPKAPLDANRIPIGPGWCRWHKGHTVVVPDGKKMGEMVEGAAGWPKGGALHELARAETIITVAGHYDEKKSGKADSKAAVDKVDGRLSFVWYVILEAEDALMTPDVQDSGTVRKIPQRPFTEILNNLRADESLQKSLLLRQIPDGESNEKNLSPIASGFTLLKGDDVPKSACVMPVKPKKSRGESEASKKGGKDSGKGKEEAKQAAGAPSSDVLRFFKSKAKPGESAKEPVKEPVKEPPKEPQAGEAGEAPPDELPKETDAEMPHNEAPSKQAAKPPAKPAAKGSGKAPAKGGVKRAAAYAPVPEPDAKANPVPTAQNAPESNEQGKQTVSVKRRRTEMVEHHDGLFCDDLVTNVDFERPSGATGFEAVITWKFN